ncbi:MAG: hypothetical protein FD169_1877 [Bacillota bacterium]|nr:MAG: hypothetical protein FD169_1877 [Bacillota bacterium]
MSGTIIGLLAETNLHPGSGQTAGAIDLPVSRESTTQYPFVAGSSMKGAMRAYFQQWRAERVDEFFGKDEAGALIISDARVLLLPVRSLTGHYRWVTCPYLLERFQRDFALCSSKKASFEVPKPQEGEVIVCEGKDSLPKLFVEEFAYTVKTEKLEGVIAAIAPLLHHESMRHRLVEALTIIADTDFKYFAQYGLCIRARNVLDDTTKTSKNLWYEESIPSDTLLYSLCLPRFPLHKQVQEFLETVTKHPYIQIGGNETVGQGWCVMQPQSGGDI